jgi:hypothetical protein
MGITMIDNPIGSDPTHDLGASFTLNATDWEAFIRVLENPPEPSAELQKAWCAYHAEKDADTES